MSERPKVLIRTDQNKDLFEVRLRVLDREFSPKTGRVERFFAEFEVIDQYGNAHIFDSEQVDIEDILAEYKVRI